MFVGGPATGDDVRMTEGGAAPSSADAPSTAQDVELAADWAVSGLTAAEVAERKADGRVNRVPDGPGRTTAEIVRANVLTPVNAIVGVLVVLVVVANGIGPDMLFGLVIVTNSLIGIVQELRARATLEQLAVLTAPKVVARRDGVDVELGVEDVVADDLLVLAPGSQVVVDGEVVDSAMLELNESLLTGESDPLHKDPGAVVLSGSFVAAGSGTYRATKIGGESYAASLAAEAKKFTMVRSELRDGINRILKVLMVVVPFVAAILLWRSLASGQSFDEALTGMVASSVAMVPDGLVLLTSVAFMAGVVTLARKGALLEELASVELLARVNTLCLDKTGTITTGDISFADLEVVGGTYDDAAERLAALASSDPSPNATLAAIGTAFPAAPEGWTVTATVPFASARKWSAAKFEGPSSLPAVYMGAPEFLLATVADDVRDRVMAAVSPHADSGQRVVLLAAAPDLAGEELPDGLEPLAAVLLEDTIRPDAGETLQFFSEQGVELKVISGDNPTTVTAVARRAGVPMPDGDDGLDARSLPEDQAELAGVVAAHTVFGRVTPQQKRAMVQAIQSTGGVVGMTGDGVNDVLALKDADMGIAMGAGSGASRAVAQLVLMDNRFSALPGVLAEARRVTNSVERAANLFIYGTVYSAVIALCVAAAGVEFPFLPRHLTLVRSLSVGIPGLFLALAPDNRRTRPGFVDRVVKFAFPAGATAAVAVLVVYFWSRSIGGVSQTQEQTAATLALLGVGLLLLVRLTRTLPSWRWYLVGAMAACVAGAMVLPPVKKFFALDLPPSPVMLVIAAVVAVAAVAVHFVPVGANDHA